MQKPTLLQQSREKVNNMAAPQKLSLVPSSKELMPQQKINFNQNPSKSVEKPSSSQAVNTNSLVKTKDYQTASGSIKEKRLSQT